MPTPSTSLAPDEKSNTTPALPWLQIGHAGSVWVLAFSADGKQLVSGSDDNTAILWDAETRQKLLLLEGHRRPVRSVSISRDGSRILTSSEDGTAILWSARTGERLRTFQGRGGPVVHCAISPDNRQVVTCAKQTSVWNAETGRLVCSLGDEKENAAAVNYSEDGKQILTVSWRTGAIVVWDAATGRRLRAFGGAEKNERYPRAAFDSKARRAITVGTDQADAPIAHLWDTESGKELRSITGSDDLTSAFTAISADGKLVLIGDQAAIGEFTVWDAETGEKQRSFADIDNGCASAAFSPDGKRILIGGEYPSAIIPWDVENGKKLDAFAGDSASVGQCPAILSPDGKTLLTESNELFVTLWSVETGDRIAYPVLQTWQSKTPRSAPTVNDSSLAVTSGGPLSGMRDQARSSTI